VCHAISYASFRGARKKSYPLTLDRFYSHRPFRAQIRMRNPGFRVSLITRSEHQCRAQARRLLTPPQAKPWGHDTPATTHACTSAPATRAALLAPRRFSCPRGVGTTQPKRGTRNGAARRGRGSGSSPLPSAPCAHSRGRTCPLFSAPRTSSPLTLGRLCSPSRLPDTNSHSEHPFREAAYSAPSRPICPPEEHSPSTLWFFYKCGALSSKNSRAKLGFRGSGLWKPGSAWAKGLQRAPDSG